MHFEGCQTKEAEDVNQFFSQIPKRGVLQIDQCSDSTGLATILHPRPIIMFSVQAIQFPVIGHLLDNYSTQLLDARTNIQHTACDHLCRQIYPLQAPLQAV